MNSEGQKERMTLSRDELYALVWKTPMARLAVQFGISGNGLSKICSRLNVPVPPRGYWAKKAAGKPAPTFRLPNAKADAQLEVTITPTPKSEPIPAGTQELLDKTKTQIPEIIVPARLTRPHPIVAKWLAVHRENVDYYRRNNWGKAPVMTEAARRRHRILHALFRALERQGAAVEERDHKTLVALVKGEPVEFQIRQKSKMVKRLPTAEEKRSQWRVEGGFVREMQQTSRLALVFRSWMPDGFPKEFAESDDTPLEAKLPEIVAAFIAGGPFLVARRRQHDEAARLYQIEQARLHELQRQRKCDDNRWRRFLELAEDRRSAALAAELVAALRAGPLDTEIRIDGRSLPEWLGWAEGKARVMDPQRIGASAVFTEVSNIDDWTYRN